MKTMKMIGLSTLVWAMLVGCGSDSSSTKSETENGTEIEANETTSETKDEAETTETATKDACIVDGNSVVGTNGSTCKDGVVTVKCSEDSKVTINGMLTGNTVNLNGRVYSCQ